MDIELRHIHKRFGPVHANNDINVTFKGGRIIGILGENGAGKSTLMKILSGFQPADEGEIWIDGKPIEMTGPQAAIANGVGMLQQDPLDVPAFTVLENFMYGQPGRSKNKADTGGNSMWKWLDRVGDLVPQRRQSAQQLTKISNRFGFELDPEIPIEQLSIAERQQLEVVRLLALGVQVLILDEPTTGISAEQKETLFGALKRLAHDEGMTVLLVSHKLEDVVVLCDEVIVLRSGAVVDDKVNPTTTQELVQMMFGQDLASSESQAIAFGEPVLEVRGLHLRRKRLDMSGISLTIRAGEVIGLAGLDGSGQGLLMRACAGLHKATAGEILLNGVNMVGRPYRQFMASGVVFGAAGRIEEGLIAGLTLTEHMALVSDQSRLIDWTQARERTESQIERYRVRGKPDDTIEQLSGGNQQRVLMALLPEAPLVLILEQPTRGLDVDSASWIWRQLAARRRSGTSIIFSSAELEELVAYSDRILVFSAGQIFEVPDVSQTSIDELGHLIGGWHETEDTEA